MCLLERQLRPGKAVISIAERGERDFVLLEDMDGFFDREVSDEMKVLFRNISNRGIG